MPYNGSGVFTRVYNWVSDAAAAIPITASRVDSEDDGFATGLSNAICRDGQTAITANLPMAGFRHTGVGNAVARSDYAAAGQIQDAAFVWVAGGGTVDAITATYSPAVTALVDGMELRFRATGANTSTTPTFSPNGISAATIVKDGGTSLIASDIRANLAEYTLRYNLSFNRWTLLNPSLALYARTASPAFSGTPTAPTAAADTNTTQVATTAFVLGQAASQAQMETATNNTAYATPGRVQNHPGVAKAWVRFTVAAGTATISVSYNVASVTRTANGEYSVTFTTAFSSANYAVTGSCTSDSGNMSTLNTSDSNACTASVARLKTFSGSGTNVTDISTVYAAFYGDQ